MSAPQDGAPALPSPSQLAWLLVQPPSALSGPDAALVARVEQDPTAAHVAGLASRLTALVRGLWGQPDGRPCGGAHGVGHLAGRRPNVWGPCSRDLCGGGGGGGGRPPGGR